MDEPSNEKKKTSNQLNKQYILYYYSECTFYLFTSQTFINCIAYIRQFLLCQKASITFTVKNHERD